MKDVAQSKSSGFSDIEYCSNDDANAGDVEPAPKKLKKIGSELQLHNYFSLPARQPTAQEIVQLAKDSDSSHVMRPKGKLAVFLRQSLQRKQSF